MIQGKFRWFPILVSVLLLAALGTGFFFLNRYQKRQLQSQLLELAIRDEDLANQLEKANATTNEERDAKQRERARLLERSARFLRQYLAVQPNDKDASIRLANLLEKHAQSPRGRTELLSVYERVLELDGEQNDIRLRAAKLCRVINQVENAIKHFEKLQEKKAGSAEVHYLLGECYAAKFRAGVAAKATKEEVAPHAKVAQEQFREAIKKAPSQLEAYASLARFLRNDLSNPQDSFVVLEEMIKANSENVLAYLISAELRQATKDLVQTHHENLSKSVIGMIGMQPSLASRLAGANIYGLALQEGVVGAAPDVQKARELSPEKVEVLLVSSSHDLFWAQLQQAEGRKQHVQSARAYATKAHELYKNDSRVLPQLAKVELAAGERKKAIDYMKSAVEKAPNAAERSRLLWELTLLMLDDEQWVTYQRAILDNFELLEKIGQEKRQNVTFLRARLKVRSKEWRAAIETFEGIRAALQGNTNLELQTDMLLGFCYEQLGDTGMQLSVYQRAVKLDLFNPLPRFAVARTLAARNKIAEAIEECRSLRKLPRYVVETDYLFARLLVLRTLEEEKENQNWTEVDNLITEMQARDSGKGPELAMLRAEVAFAKRDDAEKKNVEVAKKILRDEVIGFNPAEEDKAKETKSDKKTWPDHQEAWFALALLETPEAAKKILAKAAERFNDPVDVRIAKLRYMPEDRKDAAAYLRPLADNVDRYDPASQLRLLSNLAFTYERIGEKAAAEKIWLSLRESKHYEKDLRVRLAVFDYYLRLADLAGMKDSVEKIRGVEGQGGPICNLAEAQLIVTRISRRIRTQDGSVLPLSADEMADCRKARRILLDADVKRQGWDRVSIILAAVAELMDEEDLATNHLREALARGNRQQNVIIALVNKLNNRRQFDEVAKLYRMLKEKGRISDVELNFQAAQASIFSRNLQEALDYARDAVPEGSKNFHDYLQQGELLMVMNEMDDAKKKLDQAKALAPTEPAPWLAMIRWHLRKNNKEDALNELAEMQAALKKVSPATESYATAHGHLALGDVNLAEKEFHDALKKVKDDLPMQRAILESLAKVYIATNKPKEAEPILRQILERRLEAGVDLQFWARRTLGMALWFQGDEKKQKEGLDAIEENLAKNERSVDDLIAKASLLATVKNTNEKAIEALDKAARYRALNADQLFLLAQLHDNTGNWNKARGVMLKLLSENDNHVKYRAFLSAYIDMLVLHKDFADADLFRGRLQESVQSIVKLLLEPKDRKTNKQLPLDSDRFAAACAMLTEVARRHPQLADVLLRDNERTLITSAAQTGKKESYLALAEFLGACRRYNEALDLCEKYGKDLPAKNVVNVAIAALGNAIPKDDVPFKRVARWIEDGKKKEPKLAEWDFFLGALKEREKDYAQAESLYRALIQREPENFAAVNNLAFLLALRGKADEGHALMEKVISKLGPNADLLDSRAIVFRNMGKLKDAEKDIQDALRQERTPYRLFHLAQIADASGNSKLAEETFEAAQRIGLVVELLHPLERDDFYVREERLKKNNDRFNERR